MRVLLIVALLVIPGLVHASPPPFLGKWKLVAVRTKDGSVSKDKLAGGGVTWEFKADGNLTMVVWTDKQSATANATWTVDGKQITVDENGQLEKVTFAKKGGKLELAGTGNSTVVLTFEKAK